MEINAIVLALLVAKDLTICHVTSFLLHAVGK